MINMITIVVITITTVIVPANILILIVIVNFLIVIIINILIIINIVTIIIIINIINIIIIIIIIFITIIIIVIMLMLELSPWHPTRTVTSPPTPPPLRVSTSVTITGSEEPQREARWVEVVSTTWDLPDTGVLGPTLWDLILPVRSGVPRVLLVPDRGVPDLEPGLLRPPGNLDPTGVNIFSGSYFNFWF